VLLQQGGQQTRRGRPTQLGRQQKDFFSEGLLCEPHRSNKADEENEVAKERNGIQWQLCLGQRDSLTQTYRLEMEEGLRRQSREEFI